MLFSYYLLPVSQPVHSLPGRFADIVPFCRQIIFRDRFRGPARARRGGTCVLPGSVLKPGVVKKLIPLLLLALCARAQETNHPSEPAAPTSTFITNSTDGYCQISIITSNAPDLKNWAEDKLAPVLAEWYPRLTTLLASDGFVPLKSFRVRIRPGRGVAATSRAGVTANANWIRRELGREALGSLVHEEVHVVQQYPDHSGAPGWLVEGIADYIRWFKYEPQSHGADAVFFARYDRDLNYNGSYRISANFLNYVFANYGQNLLGRVNAACRQGKYQDDLWQQYTGKSLTELNEAWKVALQKEIDALAPASSGTRPH